MIKDSFQIAYSIFVAKPHHYILLPLLLIFPSSFVLIIYDANVDDPMSTLFLSTVVSSLMQIIVLGGVITIANGVENSNEISLIGAIKGGVDNLFRIIRANVIPFVQVFIGLILGVIPGIYLAIKYALTPFVAVCNPNGAVAAHTVSSQLTAKVRWPIFFTSLIFMGIMIAIVVGWQIFYLDSYIQYDDRGLLFSALISTLVNFINVLFAITLFAYYTIATIDRPGIEDLKISIPL